MVHCAEPTARVRCGSARVRSCGAIPNAAQRVRCASLESGNLARDRHARRVRCSAALALPAPKAAVRHGCATVVKLAERLRSPVHDKHAHQAPYLSGWSKPVAEVRCGRGRCCQERSTSSGDRYWPLYSAAVAPDALRAACRDAVAARCRMPAEDAERSGLPKAEPHVFPKRSKQVAAVREALSSGLANCQTPAADGERAARDSAPFHSLLLVWAACDRPGCCPLDCCRISREREPQVALLLR